MRKLLAGLVCAILASGAGAAFYDATAHGVIGDGQTNNTAAIAEVIAQIAEDGGGTLYFPPGDYLTGSIHLESNLTLHLEAGARLIYSGNPADSPVVRSRWEGTDVYIHSPLIWADGKENITITGRGTLDGAGHNWWGRLGTDPATADEAKQNIAAWHALLERIQAGEEVTRSDFDQAIDFLRPSLVQPYECRNVVVEGVTLVDSPMWMLHPVYSENVRITGVTFISDGPNNDGIDVDSCRNVRISDCFFSTGDDCIVIKSGRDEPGRRVGRPSEFITITNCVFYEGHGGVVIGSEMSGDVRDVTASNIVCYGTDRGIRLKTARGRGGVIENLRFDNWVIHDAVREAIQISTAYRDLPPEPFTERTPVIRNIAISNVTVQNAQRVVNIDGLEEQRIENVRISDLRGSGQRGVLCDLAYDVEFHDVRIDAKEGPVFTFTRTELLTLDNVSSATGGKEPAISLHNAADVWLRDSRALKTDVFLQVLGADTRTVRITDVDFSKTKTPYVVGPDVPAGRVVRE